MAIDFTGNKPKERKLRFPRHGQEDAKALANKPFKGVYADQPAVGAEKIAGAPLTPTNQEIGTAKMVPHQQGSLNGPAENFPRQQPHGADLRQGAAPPKVFHGFGHGATQRIGKMRISGHPSAHRIGKK